MTYYHYPESWDRYEEPATSSDAVAAESLKVSKAPEPSWGIVLVTTLRLWLTRHYHRYLRRRRRPGRQPARHRMLAKGRTLQRESDLACQMTDIALFIVGRRRRAYLRTAWRSDLINQDGQYISVRRQLRHGSGYLIAAVKYRLVNDLGEIVCRRLDLVLASRCQTRTIVTFLYTVPIGTIVYKQGLYGLVLDADQLSIFALALAGGLRWLRRWRGVKPPGRRPESDPSRTED